MNKQSIIVIGILCIVLIGIIIYFGLQVLEPRTFIPDTESQTSGVKEQVPDVAPHIIIPPAERVQNPVPATLPPTEPERALRLATTEERAAYTAALPRETRADTLGVPFLDARAVRRSKNDYAILDRPSAYTRGSLWLFNTSTKKLTPLTRDVLGLMALWSPNGQLALISNAGGDAPLTLIDTKDTLRLPIRFTTISSKCALTNDRVIYCGVPKNIPPGTVLPDDYLMRQFYSDDQLIMIDVAHSRVRELEMDTKTIFDIYNPVVIDGTLFFVNRYDGKVYGFAL